MLMTCPSRSRFKGRPNVRPKTRARARSRAKASLA